MREAYLAFLLRRVRAQARDGRVVLGAGVPTPMARLVLLARGSTPQGQVRRLAPSAISDGALGPPGVPSPWTIRSGFPGVPSPMGT